MLIKYPLFSIMVMLICFGGPPDVHSSPARADAIIVLAGSYQERIPAAATLYHSGQAPVIILTNDGVRGGWSQKYQRSLYLIERAEERLVESGVPREQIIRLPFYGSGTIYDALSAERYARTHGLKKLLLVTSDYHVRRVLWTFQCVMRDHPLEVSAFAVSSPEFVAMKTVLEYEKTLYYKIRYGVLGLVPELRESSHNVNAMNKYIFWVSFLFILYTYVGYPLFLWLLAKVTRKGVEKGEIFPTVSVVIAAHNEERNIGRRIEDLLAQDYPAELLEIIVVSDGSSDRTEAVAGGYISENVRLLAEPQRGKAGALNVGVAVANGEIIVFTDVRQSFAPDAIRRMVENFNDPAVGCVSGELLFYEDGESRIKAEMGAYWRYEKWIRKLESTTGSVIGATGAVYAIRTKLFRPLPLGTILDDVLTPITCVMQGYRTVFDASAHAFDRVSHDVGQEWRRKVRTLSGNWQFISIAPELFNPLLNGSMMRFLSHKIFRLLVPFFLLVLLPASLLADGPFYVLTAILQLVVYGIAMTGAVFPASRCFRFVNVAYFFVVLNLAALVGFWRWLSGGCADAWRPAYTPTGGGA